MARLLTYYPKYPCADLSFRSLGECLSRAFRAWVVGGLRFGEILWNFALGQDMEPVIQAVQQEFGLDCCLQAFVGAEYYRGESLVDCLSLQIIVRGRMPAQQFVLVLQVF